MDLSMTSLLLSSSECLPASNIFSTSMCWDGRFKVSTSIAKPFSVFQDPSFPLPLPPVSLPEGPFPVG
ncbi:unnamed protein product [Cuscuta campestris]|uniref:Uncharacterized protein n=1 Tax=Cuscuta campestris TaxID=132261 RepID=A0A484LJK4_9ASTE|nr:unnamed protein product [Cuscuta campestris]